MSEPFSNPNCIEMVALAVARKNPIAIYTTLTGLTETAVDYLTDLIVAKRFSNFEIHLPDGTGNMRGFVLNKDYIYALENLLPLDGVKCMTMSSGAKIDSKLLNAISNSPRRLEIEKKLPRSAFKGVRRAGSLNEKLVKEQSLFDAVEWKSAIRCASTPFYDHNVILPDGRVLLCCMDYGIKHVLGNLFEQNYTDLFKSDEMRIIQSSNMSLNPEIKKQSICTACENVCSFETYNGEWKASMEGIPNKSLKKLTKDLVKAVSSRLVNKIRRIFI